MLGTGPVLLPAQSGRLNKNVSSGSHGVALGKYLLLNFLAQLLILPAGH